MEFETEANKMNRKRGLDLTADEADLSMDSIATAEAQGKSTTYDDAAYVNEERTPAGLPRRVQPRRINRNIMNDEEADELPQIAEDTSVVDEPAEQHSVAGDSNASTLSQLSTCSDISQKATAFQFRESTDESDEDSCSHDEGHSVAGTVQSPCQQLQELGPSTPASAPAPSPTPTLTSTPTTTPRTTPASTPGPEAAPVRQSSAALGRRARLRGEHTAENAVHVDSLPAKATTMSPFAGASPARLASILRGSSG